MEKITRYYQSRGMELGRIELAREPQVGVPGAIVVCPPSALKEVWSRRFPDPVTALASGWMRVRARARQHLVELPLVISDHADWDGLTAQLSPPAPRKSGSRTARRTPGALEQRAGSARAMPLDIVGYGEEDDVETCTGKATRSATYEAVRRIARPAFL